LSRLDHRVAVPSGFRVGLHLICVATREMAGCTWGCLARWTRPPHWSVGYSMACAGDLKDRPRSSVHHELAIDLLSLMPMFRSVARRVACLFAAPLPPLEWPNAPQRCLRTSIWRWTWGLPTRPTTARRSSIPRTSACTFAATRRGWRRRCAPTCLASRLRHGGDGGRRGWSWQPRRGDGGRITADRDWGVGRPLARRS